MYVYEEDGRIAGLIRVERESTPRRVDDRRSSTPSAWPTPATSGTGSSSSSCARARSAAPRGSTSPAPTSTATSSCSCRPGSCATARSGSCTAADQPLPGAVDRRATAEARHPPGAAGRRARAPSPVQAGDAAAGPAARGDPPPRLGAPGLALAGPALEPRADPALRRRRGVRPGGARRRQGRHAARRVRPGRRRQGGPAALPQGPRPAGASMPTLDPHRLRARRHRGANDAARDTATTTASSPPCEPTRRRSTAASRRPASIDRHVTLLMKETLVRVAEPALVPAGVR